LASLSTEFAAASAQFVGRINLAALIRLNAVDKVQHSDRPVRT
jgi:hypothetical protein